MDKKALAKFVNFFFLKIYAKITLKLSVAMPNSRLHTNFQLNIFIFEARASLQTLPQSLKQNANMSAREGLLWSTLDFGLLKYLTLVY